MAYSIRLPDGTLVENIPDDLSPEEAKKRIIKAFPQFAPPTSVTRRVLGDVPVGIAQGATTGIRMIADAFGADNPVSQRLKGAEEYLGGLLSAQATNNLDAMAKILKEAEDKGVLEQVKAGAQALAEAPVEVVSQFLGTAAPTILAGVGGVMARLGATGIGALQAGTGATMGAGLIKGNIYEVVKEELTNAGVDPKIAEQRAKFAQNYTGENWDQILLGTGLGAAAALGPLERIFARVPAIPTNLAAKNMVTRGVAAGVMEAAPEATQAFQEQVAANIALQREGFDVPTFRGAVANATLEGLAGFGVGAPIGMMSRRQNVGEAEPGAEQRAEETKQTQKGIEEATPPTVAGRPQEEGLLPGMVQPEPELTPEDEAELQARIAAVPPAAPPAAPPAGVAPILPPGPPPAPAPAGALIPTEPTEPSITPQAAPPVAPPVAAPGQLEMLNAQLAQIQQARLDPTLSIDDYETIGELDRRESEIFRQIQALTPQPPIVPTPVEQLQQSGTVALQQLQPGETVSVQQPPVVEPSIEESIRAQKTEERRQRQADEQARKGEFILQNRDRSTDASIEQMALIALDPDYARAGFSRTPDGAPVVSYGEFNPEQMGREDIVTTASGRKIPVQYAVVEADEVLSSNDLQGRPNPDYGNKEVMGTRAIAGNGRITGLREAFNRGNAGQYVQDMIGDSALHGVNPDVINSMQKPVLVRVMPQDQLTKDIGDDLNKSSMLELSPAEKARNDLNRVDLDALDFKENGEISNESLNQFIQAQPVEERPTLLDNGLPTKQARQRLENAIFARAYNDKSLISMFAQADDPEARLVINAMARVAPQMAKLEGAGDLDIRDIVTDAAKIIISGKRRGLKLSEIASQVDMTVDPDTRIIVDLFAQNPRSNKAAVEALTNAATIAYEESIKPAEGLFGVEPKIERRELIERMRRDYEPGRTEDVAQAQRPGAAPSDVEGAPEPSPPTVPPADQEFVLTGETEAEIRAKQAAIDEQKKREREERLAAERKAQADAERDSFALSGSDLPADEAIARGQRELTAAEPVETEAEKAEAEPKKEEKPTEPPKVSESIGRAYQNASGMIYGKTWTNSLNNQHRARLGARLRDEGYTEREAKDIVEEAVKVQSDRRLPQMDFLQLRDLLIAGKTLGLEEVPSKKPEPKKEPEAPTITPGQQKNLNYWRENVAPAIRDYLTAYKNIGVERLERAFLKPKGISATEWLLKLRDQRSEFHRGRRVSFTGIQILSKRDLWPTETGDGEVLRKAMLKAIQAINRAPGYNSDWIANMEAGSYDGIPGIEPEPKPDFGTLYSVEFDMPGDRQKDLFGSTSEAKQIGEIMEVKGKKLPPGRSPELAAAARAVQAGTMSAEEYNKLVDVYKPIPVYAEPLKPATAEQVFDALDVKKREQINPEIPNGTKVGLRLDIPAFNRKGVFVVSIHQKRTASSPGKVIGYGSVAKAKNVTFGVGNQLKALEIAAGGAKDALQTIEGEYVNVSPEQAFAEAQRAIKDPSYVQIGIDPTRHAYFFDRRTTLPVVSAEEVIQIGNMVLAKNPTFGKKANFLYNIEGGPIAGDTQPDDMSFLDRLRKEESEKREIERQEKIAYYASIRRKEVALQQRVRDYGSTLETQRQLNNLNQIAQTLKEDIDLDKQPVYTAENFMRQARAALDGVTPYKEQSISPDVFAVIQAVYMDDPRLLEGLRLSIKPEFSKRDEELRRAFGIRAAAGAFQPIERIVNLYTGTKGVTDPMVIRHELTHTLEQMMTGPQRMAIFNSYMDALKKAIKKNKDPKAQEFFDNVLKFLDKPTAKNKEAVTKTTPSYALYQFVNPSEYWAVNAEKLMAQRLGSQWDRFKKAVRKMFEKMKDIFGFNNQFAVHDVFDKIMSGSKERLGRDSIAAYIASSGEQFEFLNSIKDDSDLIAKYGHADTPMLDVAPAKRIMLKTAQNAKDSFKEMVENPSEILRMTFNPLVRGITYVRNKLVWFGTGINEADRIRYNGQIKTAEGLATASLALDNMIRGGNIATQVLFQGGIEYNPNTLMFGAVKKEKNMTKVYEAEAALKKKLGDQLGTNIIQGYLVAKRSKNIKDDVEYHEMALENVNEDIDLKVQELKALDANPNATQQQKTAVNRELRSLFAEAKQIQKEYETIKKIAEDKVTMSDTEIEDFIARDKVHPELKEILDNFTSVNQNLLKFWRQVGLLSQPRYERLAGIKDYVPWYRIMADEEDVHSPLQATTRSATNIGKEKLFGPGKPSVVDDFVIEENQNVFKIQPAKVNAVKLNSKRLKPGEYTITPQGEMTLNVPYKPGDVLVIQSERQIENIIDNMTRNVMRMTMNGLRQYAAQRIVSEYATRGADGKILTFNKADVDRGRFDFINNGRRTVVEIQDPLIAEAALGMETVGMQMWKPLAAAANFTRRTITLSPVFQARQVFKDAPTAALVTGVKNPAALIGGVYKGFISALRDSDPASSILRSAGIGGFYSPARTPEADVKRQIGIINNSTYDYVIKALDHVGDSSDMAQRIAIYNRVMAETGDEALALYQSANVINFLRHGSGQVAQALVKTVPFLNAYAQSIDVLYNALIGGGLRGMDRKKAMQRLFVTGSLLAGTTILYAMLVGDDDDYMKMDDQSKIRNYMIPGTDVILPMNTSAAFFFKAIPELVYNKVVNEGTENAIDEKRLRRAMKEAAVDLLLGPTPVPSAVKPIVEISLNRDFFTSRPVVPSGLQDLDAYQQYDMRTSDAAKLLSSLTGGQENRLLNPVEADHLIRGIFGTVGGMVAWSSNLIGESADYRPEMGLKEMPVTGGFLRPPVPRGREDLFYALKESTDRKYKTFNRLVDRDPAEAEAYRNRHPNLISFYDYTSQMDVDLKEINATIRFIGETKDPSYTPEQKRKEILELMNLKQEILEGVEQFRKEAYAD